MLSLLFATAAMSTPPPEPCYPIPSARQLAWQKLEYYAFTHFGPNTFSGKEWGDGREDPASFNPKQLDCRQWARAFKKAGMKGVIITAKHHDGFCLWPTTLSTHTVAQSPYKGDVLRELSSACKAEGLKFGVYLSPWDRNHPTYGTSEYNEVFRKMLREVLTSYGDVFEVWFDGANGEGPNGKKQVYDWDTFWKTVRLDAKNAVMFSDVGPDIRWVGNESGHSAPTCWSPFNAIGEPGQSSPTQTTGDEDGAAWIPAECDVSIRPGWFWRESENDKVKTVSQLEKIYFESVGQNGNLLLNVPPDNRGLIHDNDIAALMSLRRRLDSLFKTKLKATAVSSPCRGGEERFGARSVLDGKLETYWATDDDIKSGWLTIDFGAPKDIGVVILQENIGLGQRVKQWDIDACYGSEWQRVSGGTTIGYKRLINLGGVRATRLRLNIRDARACPTIATFAAYEVPKN
jgi:alpha-L-fucosidase